MSKRFEFHGNFYMLNGLKLRSYLDIKRVGEELIEPDLMVIMMNPGSSYPLDKNDDNSEPSDANADTTQQQIMNVMDKVELNYARVLNLLDLREPKSAIFYDFLKGSGNRDGGHSIFSKKRIPELKTLYVTDVPVIFAWGVNQALVSLAIQAKDVLKVNNPIGILKSGTQHSYYHPLPRSAIKREEWVNEITRQIKEWKTRR